MMVLRHRLIQLLAMGDAMVLNVEIDDNGTIRSRNAGPMLLAGMQVRFWSKPYALLVGAGGAGAVSVCPYGAQGLVVQDSKFEWTGKGDE